jgi:hypothetical protein
MEPRLNWIWRRIPGTRAKVVPKAAPALEAPRWRRAAAKGISVPEVLVSGDVVQWTCVAPSFMGH